jgi:hypothetical protein
VHRREKETCARGVQASQRLPLANTASPLPVDEVNVSSTLPDEVSGQIAPSDLLLARRMLENCVRQVETHRDLSFASEQTKEDHKELRVCQICKTNAGSFWHKD